MPQNSPLKGGTLFVASLFLSCCVFMQVLDLSIANVSIPYIAGDLAVSNSQGTWVITMFAVGNAISLPLTGWLATRFGSIRVMVSSIILFTFFSWLCGSSFSLDMLISMRFIQGLVAGPLIPLSQSLMLQCYPKEKKNLALAIWNMVALVGPVTGPILGGWITFDYSWPWIFYINIPVGIISAIVIWHIFKDRETPTVKFKVDYIGIILLAVGISALQILLDKGQQYDWFHSNTIRILAVVAFISIVFFLIWENLEKNPIIDLSLFRDKNFALGTVLTALAYMILFGAVVITPLWLQSNMGYTALLAGLAVSPMGIFPVIFAPMIAKALDRYSARNILAFSFFTFAFVYFTFSKFTTAATIGDVAFTRLLLGLCIALWFAPISVLSFTYIKPERLPSATGVFHFLRIFMGGVGTSLSVTLWERRATFHHSHLADTINPYNPNSKALFSDLSQYGITGRAALESVDNIAWKQAFMLSSNDLYWVSMWLSILFFFLAFLFKKRRKTAEDHQVHAAH